MKVLVFGGGIHAHRYVESLLWTKHEIHICGINVQGKSQDLSNQYNLPYISIGDLNINNVNDYDLFVIGIALSGKQKIIMKLINELKYKNSMIIDKPLCINKQEMENYSGNLLRPLKSYALVCQRDFDQDYYHIEQANSYHIKWYAITDNLVHNIEDRLPHLLSWLMLEIGNNIFLKKEHSYLSGSLNGSELIISFIKSENHGVEINNTWYKSPDYRSLNSKIVEKVYNFNKEDSINNMNRAIAVTKIICNLLEER